MKRFLGRMLATVWAASALLLVASGAWADTPAVLLIAGGDVTGAPGQTVTVTLKVTYADSVPPSRGDLTNLDLYFTDPSGVLSGVGSFTQLSAISAFQNCEMTTPAPGFLRILIPEDINGVLVIESGTANEALCSFAVTIDPAATPGSYPLGVDLAQTKVSTQSGAFALAAGNFVVPSVRVLAAYAASNDGEGGDAFSVPEDSKSNRVDVFANDQVRNPADLTQVQTKTGDGANPDVVIGAGEELEITRVGVWDDANVNGIIDDGEFTEGYSTGSLPVRAGEDPPVEVAADPTAGEVVLYSTRRDFNGVDTFWYEAVRHVDATTDVTSVGKVTVTVTPVNDIPELRTTSVGNGGWQNYQENSGDVAVFTGVDVVDPDFADTVPQANYNGAVFYALIDKAQTNDELLYPSVPPRGVPMITVDGTAVVYNGTTTIGSLAGIGTSSLKVTLNSNGITPAMIQALVTDLLFRNDSDAPSDAERIIRVFLDDAPGTKTTSHHLFGVETLFAYDGGNGTAFLEVDLETDDAVRSVTLRGNAGANTVTADQYNELSAVNITLGVGSEAWFRHDTPGDSAGSAEWEIDLEFPTWANLLTAFPKAAGLTVRLNYWDGTSSDLNLDISGLPTTTPQVPAFSNGFPTVAGDTINVQWANDTAASGAAALVVDIEGPNIYDLDDTEYQTMKVGSTWPKTTTSFAGLGDGMYTVMIFASNMLTQGVVAGVPTEVIYAGGRDTPVEVGSTFTINGTINGTTGSRTDGDNLIIDIQAVGADTYWRYYADVEGPFAATGPWSYSAKVASPVPAGYTHYFVQAYIDTNNNGQPDLDEPYGVSANITVGGTYNITLEALTRSWTRDWDLLGDAYLYVTPVNDPPVNTTPPSITGTLQYGQTATANVGVWNDDADYTGTAPAITDFAYAWYLADDGAGTNEVAIGGQTSSTLALVGAYVGKYISVKVTATDAGVGQTPGRATASTSATSSRNLVSPAPITVTAAAKTKVYGETDPDLTYTITSGALVGTDALTGALARAPGEGVGDYAINQGTLAASANYALTYVGANLTITAKPITVTADATGKTYGVVGDPALTYEVTSGSLEDGDAFTGALARVAGEDAGGYAINQGDLSAGANYTITYVGATFTIAAKPITVTADHQTKTYGDDDPALTYKVTVGALEDGDAFSGALTRVAGEAVAAYNITRGSLTAGTNYNLSYVGDQLVITQKDITVTADAQTKEYGDGDPALTYKVTVGALEDGDAFSGALTRDAGEDVAAYDIKQGTLSAGGNYNLAYVGAKLTITTRAITVTADGQTKTYGDADPALTYQITTGSLLPGDALTGALSRLPGEAAFTNYQIQQNTLTAGINYTLTYVPADLYIARKAITVTADAKTKTYGDADPALTYQITSGNLVGGDALTGALARVAGEGVGPYQIQQNSLAASDNYTLTYVPANLTIDQKDLGITADAKTKTYGDGDPAFTYQITSGALVGEDALTGALSRVAGENVGDYAIQQNTVTAGGNYNLSYVPANLTIDQRDLEITADAKSKTYGEADPALTYQITDGALVGGDAFSGALTRVAGENATTYAIQQGTLTAGGNYDLAYIGANLTIGKAPLTITADDKSRTYWQSNTDVTFTATFGEPLRNGILNGLVGGDVPADFNLTLGTDANNGDPWDATIPSPYSTTITVLNQDVPPASNYTITTHTGAFTITSGSAPTRNAANSSTVRRLVVSGQTTDIDLSAYFDDADKTLGDALVFSNLGDVVTGAGDWTVAFPARGSTVVFDPKTTTEAGTGGGTPVDITFSVKVTDSANPPLLLSGTGDGVATVYLRLIDNQAPVVTAATPADADGIIGTDDLDGEQIPINEGASVQVSVTASDATDPSGDDGIASIHFAYSWNDAEWTAFDQPPVRTGATSATSAALTTDQNTVSFVEGTKLLYVEATITDGADVVAVKRWVYTISNVNVQPTLAAIANFTVQEDNAGGATLAVTLTGVSNGGETGDPDISGTAPGRPGPVATITAVSNRTDIVDIVSIVDTAVRSGGMQTFLLTYDLKPDANGVATITVTVNDGSGALNATIVKSFTITVSPVNDLPVNTVIPSISGTPHVSRVLTASTGTWNDVKDTAWLTPPLAANFTYAYQWQMADPEVRAWSDIAGATLATFTPVLAQNGKDIRVRVRATDNGTPGTATADAYSASVFIANAAPVFTAGESITIQGYEDTASPGFSFTLAATDADGDQPAWSVSAPPGHGAATVSQSGQVVYTPTANYWNVGSLTRIDNRDLFTVTVNDGLGGTDLITVHVEVAAVNDAPTIGSLQLTAKDLAGDTVSLSKPEEINKIVVAVNGVADVDDTVFTYQYDWKVTRRDNARAATVTTDIDTHDAPELTVADLDGAGLGTSFLKDDRISVTVTVADNGGGQVPLVKLTATATKQALLGSPPWFPQVPLSSVLANFVPPTGILDEKYEMTFALAGTKVVSVVFKVTGDKESPYPAEYLAAVWPYQVKGFRRQLTYTVTRVTKYNVNTGKWVVQALATPDRAGEPTVTIEDYDDPSITSAQGGVLDRLLNSATVPKPTGDYRATFSLDSAGGYLYTWVGPGTNVEELVRFAAESDGTFPTTRDLNLVVGNITRPGTYTLTVTPVNPESQFPATRIVDQEVWTLAITQTEIDENNGTQTPPATDAWGLAPGTALRTAPEYVGTLADGQLALNLTLSWNAISGSRKYYLFVADAAGIPVREYNRVPLGTTPRVQVLLGAGRYQWQVASTDNAGNRVWSPLAWFVIEGTGTAADAAALVERYTPFVDGPIAATITGAAGGTLNLGCTVAVDDAVALTLRVYVSSAAGVVFDKWLTVPAAGPFAVSLTAADGLTLMANTQYSVSALPRNRANAINYTGPWSDPTVLSSGTLGGVFDFEAVGTMSFLTTPGRIVFDFSTSGATAADTVEYKVSLKRGTTWTTTTGQLAGAATVTLPTVVRTGDYVIVLLRVEHAGVWTGWRTFWGTVPVLPAP